MTVHTRHFDILRRPFGRLSDDPRIQALVVAFCFGAPLEALAGFGAPVAICSVPLVALGFEPMKAAVVALAANTAPVAFGVMHTGRRPRPGHRTAPGHRRVRGRPAGTSPS